MEKNRVLGLIAMTIVTIIYGVSYIAREVVAEYMHSTVIVGIQLIIMTVLFLLYNLAKKKSMKVSKKDLPMIILSGIFGTCLFHLFTVFSVTEIGANLSSLLYGFAAVFALTIDCTVRHRPLTKLSVASIIVSLVGVYILMGINFNDLASTNFKGYALCLAAIICWVVYCFLADKVSDQYETTVVLTYQAATGAILLIPFLFIFPISSAAVFLRFDVLACLFILGVVNSCLAYFLNLYAIKQIGVTISNLLLNFMPIVTVLVALLLYGVIPTMNQIIGGIIVIISVSMLNYDQIAIDKKKEVSA